MRSKISKGVAIATLVLVVMSQGLAAAPAPNPTPAARASARERLREGSKHLRDGNYDEALRNFERAFDLVPSPKIHFNFGLALAGLARYAEALTAFQRFLAEAQDATPDTRTQALGQIAELETKVGFLEVRSPDTGAKLSLDGRSLGTIPLAGAVAVDPGPHQLVLENGQRTRARAFALKKSERLVLNLELPRPEAPAPPPLAPVPLLRQPAPLPGGLQTTAPPDPAPPFYTRPWVWVATGAAVTGVAAAVLFLGRSTRYPEAGLGRRSVGLEVAP